jgi:hypothetical protein
MKGATGEASDFFGTNVHGLTAKITSNHEPSINTTTGTQKCVSVNTARNLEAFTEFSSARGSHALQDGWQYGRVAVFCQEKFRGV